MGGRRIQEILVKGEVSAPHENLELQKVAVATVSDSRYLVFQKGGTFGKTFAKEI